MPELYPNENCIFKTERLRLEIHIVPPDRRKRDISNLIKATEDSCPWFTDDSQIDELKVVRHPPDEAKEGFVVIKLETLKDDCLTRFTNTKINLETALQRPEGPNKDFRRFRMVAGQRINNWDGCYRSRTDSKT